MFSVSLYCLLLCIFGLVDAKESIPWAVTGSSVAQWGAIASSHTGQYVVGGAIDGSVYASDDYGDNWNPSSGVNSTKGWKEISCCASGQYVVGVDNKTVYNNIYLSSDYGHSWALTNAPLVSVWTAVWMNDDGNQIVAASMQYGDLVGGGVYVSYDFGATWTQTELESENIIYSSITCDSSGMFIYATHSNYTDGVLQLPSGVSYNHNHGNGTWGESEIPPIGGEDFVYQYITTANSGNLSFVVVSNIYLYLGFDYGEKWTFLTVNNNGWNQLSSSDTGKYVAATANDGVYLSDDFGVTWKKQDISVANGVSSFLPITNNGTGSIVYAGQTEGSIYIGTSQTIPTVVYPTSAPSCMPTSMPSSTPTYTAVHPSSTPSYMPTNTPTYEGNFTGNSSDDDALDISEIVGLSFGLLGAVVVIVLLCVYGWSYCVKDKKKPFDENLLDRSSEMSSALPTTSRPDLV